MTLTLKRHEECILRWFHSRMTNGFLEVINGLIQAVKRKTRDYRNVQNLIAMVYMTANKLRLPTLAARRGQYPSPLYKGVKNLLKQIRYCDPPVPRSIHT
ncbi:hypothetical protein BSK48_15910 [Paenibacillus odorifer]|nr:hypothetical protein BSK48_15910 [Paenibacillus odorifer]OMD83579.1 hypothetical protein BSK53_12365 [Paenibacillus odorifer]